MAERVVRIASTATAAQVDDTIAMRLGLPLLIAILASTGCASPCRQACDASLVSGEAVESMPQGHRNRIHVYILDEAFADTRSLRASLYEAGFTQVNTGGVFFGPMFEARIRRAHREDPEAKFLIVGRGYATGMADRIVSTLQGQGIGIESVAEPGVVETAITMSHSLPAAVVPHVAALPMIDEPAPRPSVAYLQPQGKKPVQGTLTGREGK